MPVVASPYTNGTLPYTNGTTPHPHTNGGLPHTNGKVPYTYNTNPDADSTQSPSQEQKIETIETDVLIIGAGPAGLIAANALASLGVSVHIVEQRCDLSSFTFVICLTHTFFDVKSAPGETAGQADGTQPGMIEVWQSYGLADELLRRGYQIHTMTQYNPTPDGTGIQRTDQAQNIVAKTVRYPFELLLPVIEIEGILHRALASKDVTIHHSTTPLDLRFSESTDESQSFYPVQVTVRTITTQEVQSKNGVTTSATSISTTEKRIRAKYVLGCDGAHSWTRNAIGSKMESEPHEREALWTVLDFTPVTPDFPDIRTKAIMQTPQGSIGYIGRPGGTARIYVPLEDTVRADDPNLREYIIARTEKSFKPYDVKVTKVTWFGTYHVTQAVASHFSHKNRVFLLGDACHTHSPKAGQGANASMFDAHNIAWKLAHVLRVWANPSLLSTYEDERRSFAVQLIQFDKQIFKLWGLEPAPPGEYERLWRQQNAFISGVGVRYTSRLIIPAEKILAMNVGAGERLPSASLTRHADWRPYNVQDLVLSNGLFKLLVFPGNTVELEAKAALAEFANALEVGCTGGELHERVEVFTICRVGRKDALWIDVPEALRNWENVYIDDDSPNNLSAHEGVYSALGIQTEGVALLLRPDGYISMTVSVSSTGVNAMVDFLVRFQNAGHNPLWHCLLISMIPLGKMSIRYPLLTLPIPAV